MSELEYKFYILLLFSVHVVFHVQRHRNSDENMIFEVKITKNRRKVVIARFIANNLVVTVSVHLDY